MWTLVIFAISISNPSSPDIQIGKIKGFNSVMDCYSKGRSIARSPIVYTRCKMERNEDNYYTPVVLLMGGEISKEKDNEKENEKTRRTIEL